MMSVYNLLREACGISQAEAAEHVHGTRLDTVKSWSSDRRPAPSWAINELQSLSRRIRQSGETFAADVKTMLQATPSLTLGLPADDDDARAQGFPSTSAALHAIAIAVSMLPDDAEIRLESRARIPALKLPRLEPDKVLPTRTDRDVLAAIPFTDDGRFYTTGNVNRRKYERLEAIGWLHGQCPNLSDVVYELTIAGRVQRAFQATAEEAETDPAPGGFQTSTPAGPRRRIPPKLEKGAPFKVGEISGRIEAIDGEMVRATVQPSGAPLLLSVPQVLLA